MVMDVPGEDSADSRIAQERTGPGPAPAYFWIVAAVLALAVAALAGEAGRVAPVTAAEEEVQGMTDIMAAFTIEGGRMVAAFGAGLLVFATALAGRRLFHSTGVGLLASALVALDPMALTAGHLATSAAPAAGVAVLALALMSYPKAGHHWAGSAALLVAAAFDIRTLFWGPPLAAFLLLRGHIYAAPQHLGRSLAQAIVIPGVGGALMAVAGADPWESCLALSPIKTLLLLEVRIPGEGSALMPAPATWLAGLGTLLFLGLGALGVAATQFRVARLPGRIQLRLDGPPHPLLARSLWILLLAVLSPFPLLWLPLFAMVLAAGTRELADDAPGFGLAVGGVVLGLAVIVLARAWPLVQGTANDADVEAYLDIVPWAKQVFC